PGKTGKGNLTTQSGVLSSAQYSFGSRFEEGIGTNPEELIAAAHSGCFSMKLSFILGAAGFEPTSIETKCTIELENGAITNSHLNVKAVVDRISEEEFKKCAEDAKANCPISKSLNTNITMEAALVK
ncbi:MAG TPA: OsmC family peroxiredoxin, partial [Bacteroidia bacterium]|nr:OsmC family peroxiredoxin [Bacteroidia bacterium]